MELARGSVPGPGSEPHWPSAFPRSSLFFRLPDYPRLRLQPCHTPAEASACRPSPPIFRASTSLNLHDARTISDKLGRPLLHTG